MVPVVYHITPGKPAKERSMARLNLNFVQETARHEPTENEICQIKGLAVSIEAIIKTLAAYADDNCHDIDGVCISVCRALELLVCPVIEYLSDYAGEIPAPEETEDTV
jgi:hypothetical protein